MATLNPLVVLLFPLDWVPHLTINDLSAVGLGNQSADFQKRSSPMVLLKTILVFLLISIFASSAVSSEIPKFAYVVNGLSNTISAYKIDETTGTLTPISGSPFETEPGPLAVAVDPSGKFLYVTHSIVSISAYRIDDTTGVLSPVNGSPFITGVGVFPNDVAVDAFGKFAYVPNAVDDTLSAFKIDTLTGVMTPVSGSPFPAGELSHAVAVDPSGKFVYVTNGSDNSVSAYIIDSITGALMPVNGSPFATDRLPEAVAVDPSGKFVYLANAIGNTVSAYIIDSVTGALMPVNGSPFGAGVAPHGVAVDPSGKFVYVTNTSELSSSISAYRIESTTGALTPISGSPFMSGVGIRPLDIAVDPSGKFVYVPNSRDNTISVFSIDSSTGALTPVSGSPFTTGAFPIAVAIAGQFVMTIALDVRPGTAENPINPKSNGVIPVAILSTNDFDASTTDQTSVKLGPDQALSQRTGQLVDVNGDGLADLVLHFRTQESGIQCGDTSVSITGQTVNGELIQGTDTIRTVGCNAKPGKKN